MDLSAYFALANSSVKKGYIAIFAKGHCTHASGPFMLVSIPQGRYVVTVRHDGDTQRRTVEIGKTAHVHEAFVWSM